MPEGRAIIPVREHKRRGRRTAKQAATLTPQESEALSMFYGGRNPQDISEVMGVSADAVRALLRSAELKQPAPRYDAANREIEQAAKNWHPVQVAGGPDDNDPALLAWYRWPYRDSSPDRGKLLATA